MRRQICFSTTLALALLLPALGHAGTYSDSRTKTYAKAGATTTFKFSNLPPAVSPVTVDVDLWGEYESGGGIARFADVDLDGASTERMCDTGCSPNCNTSPHSSSFQVAASAVSDGSFVVTVQNSENAGLCRATKNEIRVRIEYDTNAAPTAQDGEVRLQEDSSASIELQASDPDGDALTWEIASGPMHGSLSGAAPNLTYAPDANYNGSDQFQFRVSDGSKSSKLATVAIIVEPVNDPPTWTAPQASTFETRAGEPFELQIEATDPDGDTIEYAADQIPQGSSFQPAMRRFTWTPTADRTGPHTLRFSATDGDATISREIELDVRSTPAEVADTDDVGDAIDTSAGELPGPDTSYTFPDTSADPPPSPSYSLRGSGCATTAPSSPISGTFSLLVALLVFFTAPPTRH